MNFIACLFNLLSTTIEGDMLFPWTLLVFALGLAGVAIIILYTKGKIG